MNLMTGLLDRLLFAAGLIVFLQIPQFIDHYTQRFGGYHQAVADSVATYQRSADRHYRGDLGLMIARFKADAKPALREVGEKMDTERTKLESMTRGLSILQHGNLLDKLAYLAGDLDMSIARATFDAYRPGLPLTTDAMICGLFGGMLASALFSLLLWPLQRLFDRRPIVQA